MTPLATTLRDEIRRDGPVPFRRFMEVALYDPGHGYYRRGDPFGKSGDFYTAEQIQPTFGLLIASLFQDLRERDGTADWQFVELGAGRAEMAPHFNAAAYTPIDVDDSLPPAVRGVVFANEFFDALPVDLAVRRGSGFRLMRVGTGDNGFEWVEAEPVEGKAAEYLIAYAAEVPDGGLAEIGVAGQQWMRRIGESLVSGYALIIDYGYTTAELRRFPRGTLMSYRRHRATEQVLDHPGEQDITAHVSFTAVEDAARGAGFEKVRFETLGQTLLRIGEADDFGCVLSSLDPAERQRRMLQLKTLIFGMGETFRTLLLRKIE